MPTYVHLHRQALSSWVFEDSRRWHLFCYLLMKADEQGRAEVSINEYANRFGIPHTTCLRLLAEMEERGMIGLKADKKRTRITICKYVYYNTTPTETRTINGQPREEKEGERESNVSPTPLSYKEKDKEREEFSATTLRCANGENHKSLLVDEAEPQRTTATVEEGSPVAPSFQQFWDAYAYKRDRHSAERAWQRLSAADRLAAYNGIAAYRADCAACQRQMMYAQGYLSHRRWEDDFTTAQQPNNPNYNYAKNRRLSREELRELDRRRRMEEYASVAAYFRNKGNHQ